MVLKMTINYISNSPFLRRVNKIKQLQFRLSSWRLQGYTLKRLQCWSGFGCSLSLFGFASEDKLIRFRSINCYASEDNLLRSRRITVFSSVFNFVYSPAKKTINLIKTFKNKSRYICTIVLSESLNSSYVHRPHKTILKNFFFSPASIRKKVCLSITKHHTLPGRLNFLSIRLLRPKKVMLINKWV